MRNILAHITTRSLLIQLLVSTTSTILPSSKDDDDVTGPRAITTPKIKLSDVEEIVSDGIRDEGSVLPNSSSLVSPRPCDNNNGSNGLEDDGLNAQPIMGVPMAVAENDSQRGHSLAFTIIVLIIASLMSSTAIIGNGLVILVIFYEPRIRASNYFLLSLAFSDLWVGLVSIPLFTYYVLNETWELGQVACKVWTILDWTICLAGLHTVLIITLDRYLSVKTPIKYHNWRTNKKVLWMVALAWIVPACIYPPLFANYKVKGYVVDQHQCEAEFMSDPWNAVILSLAQFWAVAFLMIFFYWRIYKVAKSLQKNMEKKLQKQQGRAGNIDMHFGSSGVIMQSNDGEHFAENDCIVRDCIPPECQQQEQQWRTMQSNNFSKKSSTKSNKNQSHTGDLSSSDTSYRLSKLDTPKSTKQLQKSLNETTPKSAHTYPFPLPYDTRVTHDLTDIYSCNLVLNPVKTRSYTQLGDPPYANSFSKHDWSITTISSSKNLTHCKGNDCLNPLLKNEDDNNSSQASKPSTENDIGRQIVFKRPGLPVPYSSDKEDGSTPVDPYNVVHFNKLKTACIQPAPCELLSKLPQNMKASYWLKTISSVLGAFLFCYSPYFVAILVPVVCGNNCVPPLVFQITYALWYLNSAVNPFIYAYANDRFRMTLSNLLNTRLPSFIAGSFYSSQIEV